MAGRALVAPRGGAVAQQTDPPAAAAAGWGEGRRRPMAAAIRKAVFPVGGLGTRFLPATKAMPKEMLPVVDKPLIQYAVEEAQATPASRSSSSSPAATRRAIEDHFDHSFELEADARGAPARRPSSTLVRGLAAAARADRLHPAAASRSASATPCGARASCVGDEPFAVLLADDLILADTPCLRQMVEVHEEIGGNVVAVMDVPRAAHQPLRHPRRRQGRRPAGRGHGAGREAGAGQGALDPVDHRPLHPAARGIRPPRAQEKGAGGEIQLTDAMARIIGTVAVPRAPLRGAPLRLRRQGGLPRGQHRLRPGSARTCATDVDRILATVHA